MRAVVLSQPGGPENLVLSTLPLPQPPPGWVRIAVRAFGLNRSELHTRLGLSQGVTFPRVLGIEAVGVIDELPAGDHDGSLARGQQVATVLGGMGRVFDGGYAEYVVVPRRQVIPFSSAPPWPVLGAVPETLQTAYGSLNIGLDLQPGQTLLIRGGTSALGLAAATLAKEGRLARRPTACCHRRPARAGRYRPGPRTGRARCRRTCVVERGQRCGDKALAALAGLNSHGPEYRQDVRCRCSGRQLVCGRGSPRDGPADAQPPYP